MAVLSLSEAKTYLNITSTDNEAEIMSFVASAEAAIAKKCGPLEPVATTSRVPGGWSLSLPVTPCISLTSVTPVGASALTVGDLYLDTASGEVTYSQTATGFPYANYTVVYQAGRSTCPDDLVQAVKALTKHMWETQRGGTRRPGSGGGDSYSNTIPGAAYAFPFRVEQLIAPHLQVGV